VPSNPIRVHTAYLTEMKMQIFRKIGLGLLAVTLLGWSGWTLWARTRTWCPVDVPLSLFQGGVTTTSDFTVNLTGPYDIEVEATGNGNVPLKEVTCSLGIGPLWPEKACSTKSVVRTSWKLTNQDKTIAEGLSDSEHGGWTAEAWSQAGRTIGAFNAQRGQTFKLRVQTLADATSLSATNPRLKVRVGGTAFESTLVFTGLLNVAFVVIGILGVLLVLISFRYARRKSFSVNGSSATLPWL
jgi:hypothetical protein